ncbi:MAG: hypothetical protein FJ202_08715 [Gemmatimonadetes bacterium]|nr:hypothetical protein [Gemmatimonadota bacterium]
MSQTTPLDPLFLEFQLAVAGKYSIDREIGRGGMGVVYLAREVHLDRPVAIKLLPPERARDTTLRERFLREARLAAKLSHPNIIPIHAVAEAGDFVFYVMAFVDGVTLAERVRSRGPMSASDGTRVLREAAWALAHAHEQGLVHRDVKPDNILLEHGSGRALVADFGIAAAVGAASTDGVSGTPEFMSPEQALGKDLDARSDIYSLGATAFYAFSGRLPFEGRTHTEVLAKQITEPAPALASLGLAISRKVALIVDRCLAKDANHRPANANVLAEQLGVALEQRKELPVALRVFVKRNGRLDGGASLLYPVFLLSGLVFLASVYGGWAGWTSFAIGMTTVPFGYFVTAAKKFLSHGFAHQDLAPAFKAELENAREEFAVQHMGPPGVIERGLKVVLGNLATASALVWGGSFATFVWMLGANPRSPILELMALIFAFAGGAGLMFTIGYLMVLSRRRDTDTEIWNGIWTGPIGRAAFAAGQKLLGAKAATTAMTHRATELSLGMAAEQLYDALPRDTRAELGDLPSVLKRLQQSAHDLRRRHDDLNDALTDAGDSAASAEYAPVRARRDELQGKLGEAVGALETIRLNLLRLHAGSGSVEGLTTHIGIAAEVSDEVQRLLAARAEVEQAIAFPRETVPTPV